MRGKVPSFCKTRISGAGQRQRRQTRRAYSGAATGAAAAALCRLSGNSAPQTRMPDHLHAIVEDFGASMDMDLLLLFLPPQRHACLSLRTSRASGGMHGTCGITSPLLFFGPYTCMYAGGWNGIRGEKLAFLSCAGAAATPAAPLPLPTRFLPAAGQTLFSLAARLPRRGGFAHYVSSSRHSQLWRLLNALYNAVSRAIPSQFCL